MHIDGYRTLVFFLLNETPVTAKWTLNYVKFPQKSVVGFKTTTRLEQENLQKTDDPDVFEFSVSEVHGVLFIIFRVF